MSLDELAAGIIAGDTRVLAKALSLADNKSAQAKTQAAQLLQMLAKKSKHAAMCIGISGPPGVGKSTFIDVLGALYLAAQKRVAVLAIDPSSTVSRGSILGDKTRMTRLASSPHAFVRPQPSRGILGGVNPGAEAMLAILRAAPFDVVMVESVGVGQSEASLAKLVDHMIVLVQPGAGDELQAMKKGILEQADSIVVNKEDGAQHELAQQAMRALKSAAALGRSLKNPQFFLVSAKENRGLDALFQMLNMGVNH